MIAIPAVDLREGACVQLVGGDYDRERIRLADPPGVARAWAQMGFRWVHVVDLDAATRRGSNADVVRDIVRELDGEGAGTQVGGGVRNRETIERLLEDGVQRVVVGTRAIEEPDWLERAATAWPGRLIVAADVRERRVVTRGWTHTLPRQIDDLLDDLNDIPLGGVLVTAVHREGRLAGADLPLMEDASDRSVHPILASGGIATLGDLRALADAGVAGAVIGMALYTGALDGRVVAEEFGE